MDNSHVPAPALRYLPMTKEPRTAWQYSNHMYWTVSNMIEVHSGMDLEKIHEAEALGAVRDGFCISLH